MTKGWFWTFCAVVLMSASFAAADANEAGKTGSDAWCHQETMTNGFCGFNDKLAPCGIELLLGVTQIYQQNTHGGLSTHRRAGRWAGSYDLEMNVDMKKLAGIEGGRVYILAEGNWSKSAGIDGPSVGSYFGVNGDAMHRRSIEVTELWYEQWMADNTLALRVGKIDLTGGFECRGCPVTFDGSAYANDETSQFLNSALVNNPTIPFGDYGLAAILYYNPIEWWYISGAIKDAQADVRETGFRTTFHGEDYFLYTAETGFTPHFDSPNGELLGAYRFGLWYDPQPKANSDYAEEERYYRDDIGYYTSFDQFLIKENAGADDTQGLGAFFRYGYSDSKTNDLPNFWSAGLQYQGIFDGRDNDVLAAGFARGFFSNKAKTTYTEDYESVVEVYYSAEITPWLHISPSLQYIANPGGNGTSDAIVFGTRLQMVF